MPFGLCNATATIQRLMAQALTNVSKKYGNLIMCYVDDAMNTEATTVTIQRGKKFGYALPSNIDFRSVEILKKI